MNPRAGRLARVLVLADRYLRLAAARGDRERARELTTPINAPRGIAKDIQNNNGVADDSHEDASTPGRKDILPSDVFNPSPNATGVLNLAQTGKDLSQAIKQTEHDKGHDSVSNLSQYLIRTDGGGSGSPAGKKLA